MRRFLRYTGIGLLGLIALALVLVGVAYAVSIHKLGQKYPLDVKAVAMRTDSVAVAEGRHITEIRGCFDCHGTDFGGKPMDVPAILGRVAGANLTPGGPTATWSDADFTRAIRNGVDPTGRPLLVMPSQEYHNLSDRDIGALIAFFRSLPAVRRTLPENRVGPLGRILHVTGAAPIVGAELIAAGQDVKIEASAEPGPNATYGKYLASSCIGCHGGNFSGSKLPGMPPDVPVSGNLTPHPEGLARYTEAEFASILRTGVRPDGSKLHPVMPVAMTSKLTDDEVAALWAFFQTLPPLPKGTK